MASVLAEGITTIYNAACEPYIQQLCKLLCSMGAKIEGVGSNLLKIQGVQTLNGAEHRVLPDMIEIGSWIGLAAMTKSNIRIKNVSWENMGVIPNVFRSLGINLIKENDDIVIPEHKNGYEIKNYIDGSILSISDAPWPGFSPDLISIILVSVISLLLIIQPDIGQTLLVVFSWAVLIFTSGINIYILLTIFITGTSLLAYLIIYVPKFDYIQARIFSFFNREVGTHNFQSDKAIESIISGGFFGKGIGEGVLKNRVPEAHTDYIISVISEEFGVVAIMLILLLFLILIYMVFKKISFETNDKAKLILIGSISLILMQATIHIGVNIRLFPTTGMTLPFLSYGGSSIISTSILAGIILNLTKRKIS